MEYTAVSYEALVSTSVISTLASLPFFKACRNITIGDRNSKLGSVINGQQLFNTVKIIDIFRNFIIEVKL